MCRRRDIGLDMLRHIASQFFVVVAAVLQRSTDKILYINSALATPMPSVLI